MSRLQSISFTQYAGEAAMGLLVTNGMNSLFCLIGLKLRDDLPTNDNSNLNSPQMNNKTIYINCTNINLIKNIVRNMKIKAGGVDNISTRVLKCIIDSIAGPLVYLFNRCIELGVWPNALKKAEVVPIHKAELKSKEENYKPISLTSNLAKIYEKNYVHKNL